MCRPQTTSRRSDPIHEFGARQNVGVPIPLGSHAPPRAPVTSRAHWLSIMASLSILFLPARDVAAHRDGTNVFSGPTGAQLLVHMRTDAPSPTTTVMLTAHIAATFVSVRDGNDAQQRCGFERDSHYHLSLRA